MYMWCVLYACICCRVCKNHDCWKYVFPQESSCFLDIPLAVEENQTVCIELQAKTILTITGILISACN